MKQMETLIDTNDEEVNKWIKEHKRRVVLSIKKMYNPILKVIETIIIYDEARL